MSWTGVKVEKTQAKMNVLQDSLTSKEKTLHVTKAKSKLMGVVLDAKEHELRRHLTAVSPPFSPNDSPVREKRFSQDCINA